MANPIAWGIETARKVGTKAAGKGKMMWKTIGGGMSDDVAEQIGRETGEKLASIDASQAARRNTNKIYNSTIKEARYKPETSQDVVQDAIEKGTKGADGSISFKGDDGITYQRTKNPNWHEGDVRKSDINPGGRNQWIYTADGKSINGQKFGQAQSSFKQSGGTFTMEEEVANGLLDSVKETWDGIPDWAKYTGITTAGVIAGAVLFDDDDDY